MIKILQENISKQETTHKRLVVGIFSVFSRGQASICK